MTYSSHTKGNLLSPDVDGCSAQHVLPSEILICMSERHFNLQLHDGSVSGRITVTGGLDSSVVVMKVPRRLIGSSDSIRYIHNAGAYVLIGPSSAEGKKYCAWAGYTDDLIKRLRQHITMADRDFFTHVVFITHENNRMNREVIACISDSLKELIKASDLYELYNAREPDREVITGFSRDSAQDFLETGLLMASLVGFNLLDPESEPATSKSAFNHAADQATTDQTTTGQTTTDQTTCSTDNTGASQNGADNTEASQNGADISKTDRADTVNTDGADTCQKKSSCGNVSAQQSGGGAEHGQQDLLVNKTGRDCTRQSGAASGKEQSETVKRAEERIVITDPVDVISGHKTGRQSFVNVGPARDLSFIHQEVHGCDSPVEAWVEKTDDGYTVLKGSTIVVNDDPFVNSYDVMFKKQMLCDGQLSAVSRGSVLYKLERNVDLNSEADVGCFLTGGAARAGELARTCVRSFAITGTTKSNRRLTSRIYATRVSKNYSIVLIRGSEIFVSLASYMKPVVVDMRSRLLKSGGLYDHGDYLELMEDVLFTSASTAAEFVRGYSVNGREAWKNDNGQTFKEVFP